MFPEYFENPVLKMNGKKNIQGFLGLITVNNYKIIFPDINYS